MFQLSVSWGIAPSEFWGMTINEWFSLLDLNTPEDGKKAPMSTVDKKALIADLNLSNDEWWSKHGRGKAS